MLLKLASYRVVSERSKGRGLGPRCRRFESCLLDLLKLWKCGNDGELRQTVNLVLRVREFESLRFHKIG